MLEITQDGNRISLAGELDRTGAQRLLVHVSGRRAVRGRAAGTVFDLSGVTLLDSAGAAVLDELADGGQASLEGVSPDIERAYKRFGTSGVEPPPLPAEPGLFERLGHGAHESFRLIAGFLLLLSDSLFWAVAGLFSRKGHRKGAFVQQSVTIGVEALPVVSLTTFLVGLIMAVLSAGQLKQFGANVFVADLVSVAMAREMGPIMTAIIMAGRSGSAIASEIATMKVTEEIDALETMGINPVRFVVVPKVWAISVVLPLLTLLSVVVGISGGMLVGFLSLDISPAIFLSQASGAISLGDIVTGMGKSLVFAWLIVVTASFFGMQAAGGPEGVGKVTTSSVVTSIFLVIIADAVMALIIYL